MNDIRRTILWVIFGFSLVFLWDKWQIHNGRQALFFPVPTQQTAAATPPAAPTPPATSGVPSAASTGGANAQMSGVSAIPGAPTTPLAAAAHERVTIRTDVLEVVLDTQGGTMVKTTLPGFATSANNPDPVVVLDDSPERMYLAQTGLTGGTFPTHQTVLTLMPGERTLQDGQKELSVRFESPAIGDLKLVKTYTFERGSYAVRVKHEVFNVGTTPLTPQIYMKLVRDGNKLAGESSIYSTFTGPAVYTEAKKFQKIDFKDIEKDKVSIEKTATNGFVAMVQHYFASAWLLADDTPRELFTHKDGPNLYAVGMMTPLPSIAPGASASLESRLFVGPQKEGMLAELTPGLELVKDYGIFKILSKPLYLLLTMLHSFLGNWGWSIVALVALLKAAFYWLNAKAYASMAKMKAVNPRITEMRERLKDKPQQIQQEMMKIYREEKINPLGGCFPIMIQIPVFISLYWVLLSSVEMRGAPWILWIHDLSAPDPFFILPLLMTLTSLLQTWLNPVPPDPMQAKMMWLMPLAFSVMFFFFPSGLVLYWVTNNSLSILQQWFINKRLGVLHKPTNPLKLFMKQPELPK